MHGLLPDICSSSAVNNNSRSSMQQHQNTIKTVHEIATGVRLPQCYILAKQLVRPV